MAKKGPKKGSPKPAGSGRKKGTKNKRTLELEEALLAADFNPIEKLVHIFDHALDAYARDKGLHKGQMGTTDNRHQYLEIARKAASDITPYLYPKRKAVEHSASGDLGESVTDVLKQIVASRQKK